MKKSILTILIMLLLSLAALLKAEELKVTEIGVKGNKILSQEAILAVVKTTVGDPLSKKLLTKDIKEIFNLNIFDEVKVDLLEEKEGIKINFIVVEKPTIKEIKFLGNKEITQEKLKENFTLIEGDLYDENKLKELIGRLENLYRSEGFYYVKISSQSKEVDSQLVNIDLKNKEVDSQLVDIDLKIEEGKKVKIKEINFVGNESFSSWRLKWIISTGKRDYFTKEKIEEDLNQILYFYNNKGYFLCQVELDKVYFDDKKKGLVVNIHINEGDIYLIDGLKFVGSTLFTEKEFLKEVKTGQGKKYSLKDFRGDQGKIMEMYSQKGYISVQIIPKPFIDKEQKKISFEIEIREGEKCFLEKVSVSGNEITKDKVILREVLLKPGEIFDGQKINLTQKKLYQLGFFEQVNMEVIPGDQKNKKILNIKVKERKTGTISLGTTWSSQYGLGGSLEVAQTNLFGNAWKLNVKSEFGKKRMDYRVGFVNPWFKDTPTSLGFNLFKTEQKINEYTTIQKGESISVGREWKSFNKIYLDYKYEKVLFKEVNKNLAPLDIIEKEGKEEATSSISVDLIRDTRDNIYHTTKGYRISYLNEMAGASLGGDVDYYKSVIEGRLYLPAFWKFVLAMRTRFGVIKSITGDDKVRDDFRFYLGGAETIRGYKENDISLIDENKKEHGGSSVFYANFEYRFPIVEPLYFALFLDMGNIWDKYGNFNLNNLKLGRGFSFRIDTPMGPIRLDYGYPMNDKEKKEPEFYFSIGTPF
ncbi:MAG: outer membrane protein assembly factor BamA [bacterium]